MTREIKVSRSARSVMLTIGPLSFAVDPVSAATLGKRITDEAAALGFVLKPYTPTPTKDDA